MGGTIRPARDVTLQFEDIRRSTAARAVSRIARQRISLLIFLTAPRLILLRSRIDRTYSTTQLDGAKKEAGAHRAPAPRIGNRRVEESARVHLQNSELAVARFGALVEQAEVFQIRNDGVHEQKRVELLFHVRLSFAPGRIARHLVLEVLS